MLDIYTNLQTFVVTIRQRLVSDERGQTMAEYGVVLGVITVALVAVFGVLAGDITKAIELVGNKLPKA